MRKILACLTACFLLLLPVSGLWTTAAAGSDEKSGIVIDLNSGIHFYYENGVSVAKGLVKDSTGDIYYFPTTAGAARGRWAVPESMTNGVLPAGFYEFDDNQRLVIKNGIYTHDWQDETYYFENSIPIAKGVAMDDDGGIYFFTNVYGVNRAVTDGDWYISAEQTNGLIEPGTYHFNQFGLMTGASEKDLAPVSPDPVQIGDNLFRSPNGTIQFYEDGVPVAKGLVQDYEGNIYYLISTENVARGIFVISQDKTNGIMPAGPYEFDMTDGHLIRYEGIVKNFNGRTRYYENGISKAAGLVKDDEGHIYFFTVVFGEICAATDEFMQGNYYVSPEMTNGLKEAGTYHFNSEGYLVGEADVDLSPVTEESTAAPEEPTTPPEEPTTAPEEPTTPPEELTTAPEELTTAPEELTTAPEEPTTAPEELTTNPEEPTTAPEGLTTPPEDSTSSPSSNSGAQSETTLPGESDPADTSGVPTLPVGDGTATLEGSQTTAAGAEEDGCASSVASCGLLALLVLGGGYGLIRKRRA